MAFLIPRSAPERSRSGATWFLIRMAVNNCCFLFRPFLIFLLVFSCASYTQFAIFLNNLSLSFLAEYPVRAPKMSPSIQISSIQSQKRVSSAEGVMRWRPLYAEYRTPKYCGYIVAAMFYEQCRTLKYGQYSSVVFNNSTTPAFPSEILYFPLSIVVPLYCWDMFEYDFAGFSGTAPPLQQSSHSNSK